MKRGAWIGLLLLSLAGAVLLLLGSAALRETEAALAHEAELTLLMVQESPSPVPEEPPLATPPPTVQPAFAEAAANVTALPAAQPTEKPGTGRWVLSIGSKRVAVFAVITEENLDRGAAHASGTPEPGAYGNAVIYGHRDGAFRTLRTLEAGDSFVLTGADGDTVFVVERCFVTDPDDASIFTQYDGIYVTLVTCYPFGYVGAAPQRYAVVARAET